MISRGRKRGWTTGSKNWEDGELERAKVIKRVRVRSKFVGSWCREQRKVENPYPTLQVDCKPKWGLPFMTLFLARTFVIHEYPKVLIKESLLTSSHWISLSSFFFFNLIEFLEKEAWPQACSCQGFGDSLMPSCEGWALMVSSAVVTWRSDNICLMPILRFLSKKAF